MKDAPNEFSDRRDRYIRRVTIAYAVFAAMWIFLSDGLLAMFTDIAQIQWLSTVKGIAFVIVTAMLLLVSLHLAPDRKAAEPDWFCSAVVPSGRWPRWLVYAFALAVTGALLLLRTCIAPSFGERPLLILLVFPIILSAMLGGFGPGLVATLVALLGIDYVAVPPIGSLLVDDPADLFQLGFLGANGVLVSVLSEGLHRSWRQTEATSQLQAVTLASIGDGVITTDLLGRVTYLNPQAERLTNWSNPQAKGRPLPTVFEVINEHTRQPVADPVHKVLTTGTVVGLANHTLLLARGGLELPIHDSGAPIRLADGTMLGAVLVFRDDTERRTAERTIVRANRTLRALSLSNQALLHAESESSYLQDVCNIIVDGCGHAMAWIGFAEQDATQAIRPAAWAGLTTEDISGLDPCWTDSYGGGLSGLAVRSARPVLVRDALNDPLMAGRCAGVRVNGVGSALALPLLAGDDAFGVIAIYAHAVDGFSETEIELLEEVAGDLAYGITTLRLRDQHSRAEAALWQSETTYRSLFDNMMNSVVHCRMIFEDGQPVDCEYLAANPAFATVTGITEPVVGRRISQIIPNYCRDNPESLETFGRVARTGIPTRWEHYLAALDRWFSFVIYSPAPGEVVIVTENITERKLAENALRASERRFHDIVNASADWVWEVDAEGRYTYASESVRECLGYTPEEILGKTPFDLMPPDEARRVAAEYAAIMVRRMPFRDLHNINLHKDGSVRYVRTNGMPILDRHGNWLGCRGLDKDNTEKELAEHALRDSEARFRQLFESAPAPLCFVDRVGTLRDVNARFVQTFGYTRDDVPTLTEWWQRAYPDPEYRRRVVATWEDAVQRAAAGGTDIAPVEYQVTCKSGEIRTMVISGVTLGDDLLATFFDVTERKKVEAAIADERRHLRTLIDTIPDMVWLKDPQGRFLACNPPFEHLVGACEADIIGRTPYDFIDAELARSVLENDRKAMAAGRSRVNEEWVTFVDDGHRALLETIKTPMRDDRGRIVGVLAIGRDITDKKRAAEELDRHRHHLEELVAERTAELRRQTRSLRAVIDNIPYLVWMKDREGRFLAVNRAIAEANGCTMADLIGKTDHEVWPRDVADRYRADDAEVISRRCQKTTVEALATVPGTIYEIFRTPILDEDGEVLGTVGFSRDISDQKRLEAAREAALAEAERLARVRREFLANMSHEIRTPLNAVLGLAQVGRREYSGQKCQMIFNRILDSGQTLLGVVDDILDFSKIESGRLTVEHVPLILGDVIDHAVALVAAHAHSKHLHFVVDEADHLPVTLLGDALRLSQVLGNLLTNAVKFTPDSGRVALSVARTDRQVVFRVADTGIGMTAEQVARLFQPFEQADGSTTRHFGGTGLGLSISRSLVDLMGGSIVAESRFGEGSVFEVRLPLADAAPSVSPVLSGSVALVGLASAEAGMVLARLPPLGIAATVTDRLDQDATLVVVAAEALTEPEMPAAIERAVVAGRRVAVLLTLDQDPASPPGTVVLERPLRIRHLLAMLQTPRVAATAPAVRGGRLAGCKILAAEDNDVNRLVLTETLSFEGARVVCVENGRAALDRLLQDGAGAFDVVLTDIQMPVMDGYHLARAVVALSPTLPVIGITAHAMTEERSRCLEAGMVAQVTKPIDDECLVTTILRHWREGVHPDVGSPPIDWTALDERYHNKPAFLEKLLTTVLQAHAKTAPELHEAWQAKDLTRIVALSHSIKGTAGNLMLQSLQALAADIERGARGGAADLPADRLAAGVENLLAAITRRLGVVTPEKER